MILGRTCPLCNGTGKRSLRSSLLGARRFIKCPYCKGRKVIHRQPRVESTQFDKLVTSILTETLGWGGSIARGINRTKNLHQIPDRWRAKPFKKNYKPLSKSTRPTLNVAKKTQHVARPMTGNMAIDTAKKYGFKLPSHGKSKQLGSTGIKLTRKANGYMLTK